MSSNATQCLNQASKTCPLITEFRDINAGIAQGDFNKATLNAGILAMTLGSGAGSSAKISTASTGATFTKVAAVSSVS